MASREAINELSKAAGYVAIRGEFAVISGDATDCTFDLDHPLNRFLSEDEIKVHIQIPCHPDSLRSAFKSVIGTVRAPKLTCVGKVLEWDGNEHRMVVSPIAIY